MTNATCKIWGSMLIRGIVSIIFGLLALYHPSITLKLLIMFFGGYVFISGTIMSIFSFATKESDRNWQIYLLDGIFNIVVGILIFVWPNLTTHFLLLAIGIWAIVSGLIQIINFRGARSCVSTFFYSTKCLARNPLKYRHPK